LAPRARVAPRTTAVAAAAAETVVLCLLHHAAWTLLLVGCTTIHRWSIHLRQHRGDI
jgi:hypothetical protein